MALLVLQSSHRSPSIEREKREGDTGTALSIEGMSIVSGSA